MIVVMLKKNCRADEGSGNRCVDKWSSQPMWKEGKSNDI